MWQGCISRSASAQLTEKTSVLETSREKLSSRGQCSHGYGVCHAAEPFRAALHHRAPVELRGSILGGWSSCPQAITVPHWPCRRDSNETPENQESLFLWKITTIRLSPMAAKAECAGESSILILQARHFFTKCFSPQSLNLPALLCQSLSPQADLAAWPQSRRRCQWC